MDRKELVSWIIVGIAITSVIAMLFGTAIVTNATTIDDVNRGFRAFFCGIGAFLASSVALLLWSQL